MEALLSPASALNTADALTEQYCPSSAAIPFSSQRNTLTSASVGAA